MSLPSGHTCKPWAKDCLSMADKETGKITDGSDICFRCWSASLEARNPIIRKTSWSNWQEMLNCNSSAEQTDIIVKSLKEEHDKFVEEYHHTPVVRVHVGGEFYHEQYFLAWLDAIKEYPATQFYAYTKALPLWIKHTKSIPENFRLNASRGGKFDHLIGEHSLKEAVVVFSEDKAKDLGLEIDHDDWMAYAQDKSFALLLHGTQPAGSEASKSKQILAKKGFKGYGKTSKAYVASKPRTGPSILRLNKTK